MGWEGGVGWEDGVGGWVGGWGERVEWEDGVGGWGGRMGDKNRDGIGSPSYKVAGHKRGLWCGGEAYLGCGPRGLAIERYAFRSMSVFWPGKGALECCHLLAL